MRLRSSLPRFSKGYSYLCLASEMVLFATPSFGGWWLCLQREDEKNILTPVLDECPGPVFFRAPARSSAYGGHSIRVTGVTGQGTDDRRSTKELTYEVQFDPVDHIVPLKPPVGTQLAAFQSTLA